MQTPVTHPLSPHVDKIKIAVIQFAATACSEEVMRLASSQNIAPAPSPACYQNLDDSDDDVPTNITLLTHIETYLSKNNASRDSALVCHQLSDFLDATRRVLCGEALEGKDIASIAAGGTMFPKLIELMQQNLILSLQMNDHMKEEWHKEHPLPNYPERTAEGALSLKAFKEYFQQKHAFRTSQQEMDYTILHELEPHMREEQSFIDSLKAIHRQARPLILLAERHLNATRER